MAKYIFPYLTLPYLTRVLEPDAYAVRAYILAAMTFMQVFLDYGFNSYGTKVVAESINDEGLIHRVTSSIALLRIMLAVVGAIALLPVTSSIPIMGANPCYVAIAYLGVCFKAMLPDFIFQGKEDMGIITKRFVVSQAVATFLIFATVRAPSDLLWVPVIEALASFIALAWSWANALTVQGIRLVRPVTKELAYLFRQASIFFLSGASTTVFTALTTLMIGVFIVDQVEIAYWSVAMTAVNAIQSLYTPITNSLYPHMVKCKDFALVKKLLIVGMPVVFVGSVLFALLSNEVMWVLGGEQYLAGSYVISLVSPVLLFSFPAMLLGFPVLAAIGHVRELTTSSAISAFFHIAGLFVLVFTGQFSIACVAVLRVCTEMLLLIIRGGFAIRCRYLLRRRVRNECGNMPYCDQNEK